MKKTTCRQMRGWLDMEFTVEILKEISEKYKAHVKGLFRLETRSTRSQSK